MIYISEISTLVIKVLAYTWPMLLIFTTILVSLRTMYIIKNKKEVVIYKEIVTFLALVYILCLFYIVTFQDVVYTSSNLIPFKEIFRYTFGSNLFIRNVIGNILIFVPFGFFVSYYLKSKEVKQVIFLTAIISFVIEVIQYKIGRIFDIDDILLNIAGGFVGFYFYSLIHGVRVNMPDAFNNKYVVRIVAGFSILLVIVYFVNLFIG